MVTQRTPKASPRKAVTQRYRSGKKRARAPLDEALDLLTHNDAASMARADASGLKEHVRGKPTWASVGEWAAEAIAARLRAATGAAALEEAASEAATLHARLLERDAIKGARVTIQLRERIGTVHAVASTLHTMLQLRDGARAPSYELAGKALVLYRGWLKLGGQRNAFVRQLMEAAVGAVLQSAASAGIKAQFTRALSSWQQAAPAVAAPDGEVVTWDESDDLLF